MSYSNTISYKPHAVGKRRGIIMMELLTAILIITTLTTVMIFTIATYGRYNGILLARQRCIAAGQAQLDCIAATGKPIDEATFARLWPTVKCSITSSENAAHLTQVDVALVAMARKKEITITLSRYMDKPVEGGGL
jgi:hypothetical protein